MTVPLPGASGARFFITKLGDDAKVIRRLLAQYTWLHVRDYPYLVRAGVWVEDVVGCGYTMELLEHLPLYSPPERARQMMDALAPVWAESPLIPGPWRPAGWLDQLPAAVSAWYNHLEGSGVFDRPEIYCGTHGDATLENMMRRPGSGAVVLIDPVPDIVTDRKVPAVRALDLGKILQSGLNYERVHARVIPHWVPEPFVFMAVEERCHDRAEWELACWCCLLHVAKFLPYQPADLRARWMEWFPDIAAFLRTMVTAR